VPAGTNVLLPLYLLHRHPHFWTSPEAFDPERFAPEHEAERPRFAYMPFAAGPRHCIGETFALYEMLIHLYKVARRYRLRYVPDKPLELWSFEASPFCRIVREALSSLEMPYVLHNVGKRSPKRKAFIERSGKMMVPFLADPNTGREMFEGRQSSCRQTSKREFVAVGISFLELERCTVGAIHRGQDGKRGIAQVRVCGTAGELQNQIEILRRPRQIAGFKLDAYDSVAGSLGDLADSGVGDVFSKQSYKWRDGALTPRTLRVDRREEHRRESAIQIQD